MSGPYRTAEKSTPFESYPVWMVCFCISYSCTRTKDVDFSLLWAVQFDKLHKTAAKGLQPGLARGMMGHIENSCTQGGYTMAERRFLLVDADVLPEVFVKVLQAKELLASGAVSNISAAAKQAGISRSAFYKYKDLDTRNHNPVLSRLSYTHHRSEMVRQEGFEPPAYCLEGSCSIQLSYWRAYNILLPAQKVWSG